MDSSEFCLVAAAVQTAAVSTVIKKGDCYYTFKAVVCGSESFLLQITVDRWGFLDPRSLLLSMPHSVFVPGMQSLPRSLSSAFCCC